MSTRVVINRGKELDLGIRLFAHDGNQEEAKIAGEFERFKLTGSNFYNRTKYTPLS